MFIQVKKHQKRNKRIQRRRVHDGVDRVALITAELMIRGRRYYGVNA